MKAYVFPGQGSQYPGMAKDLFEKYETARELFKKANEILGFDIAEIIFNGSEQDLKETKVTQPAIFLHSVILCRLLPDFKPSMVAGHSLGEISALVASECLSFEEGLFLISKRSLAMQRACEQQPSTMAAILGLDDSIVEEVCSQLNDVVPANYNCPGQIVISGTEEGVNIAIQKLSETGAKKAIKLQVGGAFHSPLMQIAMEEFEKAVNQVTFKNPICPIYQNVNASPSTNLVEIKENLIKQLISPVRWTQTINNMIRDGATEIIEVGPGKVLQGLIKKINSNIPVQSINTI